MATTEDAAACASIYAPFVLESAVSFETVPPTAQNMVERITEHAKTAPWRIEVRERFSLCHSELDWLCLHDLYIPSLKSECRRTPLLVGALLAAPEAGKAGITNLSRWDPVV